MALGHYSKRLTSSIPFFTALNHHSPCTFLPARSRVLQGKITSNSSFPPWRGLVCGPRAAIRGFAHPAPTRISHLHLQRRRLRSSLFKFQPLPDLVVVSIEFPSTVYLDTESDELERALPDPNDSRGFIDSIPSLGES